MAVRFVLNDEFVAEVDEDLMREYRKMMEIPKEIGDSIILWDIMYNDIIGAEYYTDETETWIKSLKELALFYNFRNAGELLEYFMHKAMETKMDICANCNKFRDGVCLEDGRKTTPYYTGCDTLNKRSVTPERLTHNQKLYDYVCGRTDMYPKEIDMDFMIFNTKYGPVTISSKAGREFEQMAEIPLNGILVEAVIDELPDKDRSTREKIEKGVYKEALREQNELAEMREMEKRGVIIVEESDGLSLGVDEDGNYYRFKRE